MIYLKNIIFPCERTEESYLNQATSAHGYGVTYYTNYYPFRLLSSKGMYRLDFAPITILYGGNGSGKSTILNVISQALQAKRNSAYNTSSHMENYVKLCQYHTDLRWTGEEFDDTGDKMGRYHISEISHVVTSDDIFKSLLQDRVQRDQKMMKSKMIINQFIKNKSVKNKSTLRENIGMDGYLNLETGENVERFKYNTEMKRKSMSASKFMRQQLGGAEEEGMSNGENSILYMSGMLEEEGLYMLDEPENSLAPELQMRLVEMLQFMVDNNNCQFIIATHSPFLLSMPGVKIYNLDGDPACESEFEDLPAMRSYYELFKERAERFEKK